jgi:hypothetical protein
LPPERGSGHFCVHEFGTFPGRIGAREGFGEGNIAASIGSTSTNCQSGLNIIYKYLIKLWI